jgi:adenylate kinase
MLRAAVAAGTPIGKKAKPLMDAGKLVPDKMVVGVVEERIGKPDCAEGFILDGFPRTLDQAKALDRMLRRKRSALDAVIEIRVDEAELFKRIETRIRQSGAEARRSDDDPETLKARIAVYKAQTAPLIPYYRKAGNLHVVDGMRSIDEVWTEIEAILSEVEGG